MRILSFDPSSLGRYRHDAFEESARDFRDQPDTRHMIAPLSVGPVAFCRAWGLNLGRRRPQIEAQRVSNSYVLGLVYMVVNNRYAAHDEHAQLSRNDGIRSM